MSFSSSPPRKLSLTDRISHALRPKRSSSKLRKASLPPSPPPPVPSISPSQTRTQFNQPAVNPNIHALPAHLERNPEGRRLQTGAVYRSTTLGNVDEQTGERRDDTELLHGLAHHESNDSLKYTSQSKEGYRPPGEDSIRSLTPALWGLITAYLCDAEIASLAYASKPLYRRVNGRKAWRALRGAEGKAERIKFLIGMDEALPGHLLCFLCGTYHLRTHPGEERLRPNSVLNQLYVCPSVGKPNLKAPRARITPGYSLPFTFVQLALRASRYSPNHGIPSNDLERRYKDPQTADELGSSWSHQTRYYIHKNHLLVRVVSRAFAMPNLPDSGLRHLLYSREDYTPYFSCCRHWQDGELMPICKCALSHIPERKLTLKQQLKSGPSVQMARMNPAAIVSLCGFCRPMRRCPECPTEYLVELKLGEDKTELDPGLRFKQIIVVTRWSDLGDGTMPDAVGGEWNAVVGRFEGDVVPEPEEYKSFERMGKRAISGIFESQSGVTLPGQRLLSLNPKGGKKGEDGDDWY